MKYIFETSKISFGKPNLKCITFTFQIECSEKYFLNLEIPSCSERPNGRFIRLIEFGSSYQVSRFLKLRLRGCVVISLMVNMCGDRSNGQFVRLIRFGSNYQASRFLKLRLGGCVQIASLFD